ncbi:Nucleobase-ascorbate transporter 11 [Linum grandiflorum]
METGSTSDSRPKPDKGRPSSRGSKAKKLFGSMLSNIEPYIPNSDHNPNHLRSWAKKTGFVSTFSTETTTTAASNSSTGFDPGRPPSTTDPRGSAGGGSISPTDPILGRTRPNRGAEIQQDERTPSAGLRGENKKRRVGDEFVLGGQEEGSNVGDGNANHINAASRDGVSIAIPVEQKKDEEETVARELGMDMYPGGGGDEPLGGGSQRHDGVKIGFRDNPALVQLLYYSLQHYLSLAGSLIFIPIIIVPTMGGTDKDTATVISTMLMVSGVTTILHSYFGTRLPLVQGSSFVYLAPALIIMNAQEYRNLTENKFRHIMRELQGAIIVGSVFQSLLGFTGLMSLLLRLINPVVVAPTVAAVGLAFFSYGFPQAGSCVEISIPLILLVLIFTLVPMSVIIIWIYAFFLTAGGAYNFKGCDTGIPSSNILVDACRKHAYTMQHCRTDVSSAWKTAAWVRIPYPFQWGVPIFNIRTSLIMIVVSLVASVDSVGIYHSTSLLVSSKPPTPGIVSRGIALEGLCSILAGLWGSGTGSTTLTENIHTINVTKVANRGTVVLGAVFLIFFSLFGKVGAILASIPQALAAAILCFIWGLIVALGLSTLQYTQTASFRNIAIVGVSLFLGMSVPAYFQQYEPKSSLILPSYLIPYSAASDGPVNSGNKQLDFAMNGLMSLNMVVTLLIAFVLDNTVPGSRQERGVYIWSRPQDLAADPSLREDYALPNKVDRFFCWARCLRA